MSNFGLFNVTSQPQQQQQQGNPPITSRYAGPYSMPNPRAERTYSVELFSSLQAPRAAAAQGPMRPILPMGPMSVPSRSFTGTKAVQLNATNNDPVGLLIQYAHCAGLSPPDFEVLSSVGPSHKPLFDMQVSFDLL